MTNEKRLATIRTQCEEDGDCLLWTGKVNGSGAPIARGSIRREYWVASGHVIPSGKVPVPTCGRPCCLEHLGLKTYSQIAKDSIARPDVQARRAVAQKRRPKPLAKLDAQKVREIRESDLTQRAKAKAFNVTQGLISRVERNLIWREPEPVNFFKGL